MDLTIEFSIPATIEVGDTAVVSMSFVLNSPIAAPERGEFGSAVIGSRDGGDGRFEFLRHWEKWQDTLRVGVRYTLSKTIRALAPGRIYLDGSVSGGIPVRPGSDGSKLGICRFGNSAICSTQVIGRGSLLTGNIPAAMDEGREVGIPDNITMPGPSNRVAVGISVLEGLPASQSVAPLARIVDSTHQISWRIGWSVVERAAQVDDNDTVYMAAIAHPSGANLTIQVQETDDVRPRKSLLIANSGDSPFEFVDDSTLVIDYGVNADSTESDTLWLINGSSRITLCLPVMLLPGSSDE
jgi:hypothetical protein